MASKTDIAKKALLRASIHDALESPAAADIAIAENAYDDMVADLENDSIVFDAPTVEARFVQGLAAMLAVRLCEEYGKQPGPVLLRDAESGKTALYGQFLIVPESTFDHALIMTTPPYATLIETDGVIDMVEVFEENLDP